MTVLDQQLLHFGGLVLKFKYSFGGNNVSEYCSENYFAFSIACMLQLVIIVHNSSYWLDWKKVEIGILQWTINDWKHVLQSRVIAIQDNVMDQKWLLCTYIRHVRQTKIAYINDIGKCTCITFNFVIFETYHQRHYTCL